MSLILAIEPDQRQAAQLAGLVRERLNADLVHADTTEGALIALAGIGDRIPDLVLVPSLLSAQEDAAIAGALRVIATAANVRMLTIPQLADPEQTPQHRGVFAKLRGRKAKATPGGCDPAVFADQIAAYLAEAADERRARELENDDLINARAESVVEERFPEQTEAIDAVPDYVIQTASEALTDPPPESIPAYVSEPIFEPIPATAISPELIDEAPQLVALIKEAPQPLALFEDKPPVVIEEPGAPDIDEAPSPVLLEESVEAVDDEIVAAVTVPFIAPEIQIPEPPEVVAATESVEDAELVVDAMEFVSAPEAMVPAIGEPLGEIVPEPLVLLAKESGGEDLREATEPATALAAVAETDSAPTAADHPLQVVLEQPREAEARTVVAEAPLLVAEAPVASAETPLVLSEAPLVVYDEPVVLEEAPVVVYEEPLIVVEAAGAAAEAPVVVAEPPLVVNEAPVVYEEPVLIAEAPVLTAEASILLAEAAAVSAEPPIIVTDPPIVVEEVPVVAEPALALAEAPTLDEELVLIAEASALVETPLTEEELAALHPEPPLVTQVDEAPIVGAGANTPVVVPLDEALLLARIDEAPLVIEEVPAAPAASSRRRKPKVRPAKPDAEETFDIEALIAPLLSEIVAKRVEPAKRAESSVAPAPPASMPSAPLPAPAPAPEPELPGGASVAAVPSATSVTTTTPVASGEPIVPQVTADEAVLPVMGPEELDIDPMFFADDAHDGAADPAPSDRPAWVELIESLRKDIERLRAERTQPQPIAAAPIVEHAADPEPSRFGRMIAIVPPAAAPKPAPVSKIRKFTASRTRQKPSKPIQDQWGLFDPEQCGFAALRAKLDEISARDDASV